MKKLLNLRALFMLLIMTLATNVWGEEVVSYTFSTTQSGGNTAYATNYEITVNEKKWSCPGNQNFSGYVRIGGKNLSNTTRNIFSKESLSDDITKVVLNHNGVSNASLIVNSITLTVASDANFTNDVQTKTLTSPSVSSEGALTFSPATGTWGANKYYKITFDLTNGKSSNYGLDVTSIVFYKENGGSTPSTPTVTAPTFDVAAGTYTEDKLVLIDNYDENYLYAYTLDGSDPAIDAELNVTNGTEYDENEGIEITSSCTLKVIACDEDGNTSSITSAAYVINKPIVYNSLEELVAADIATGTTVTVSFENVPIKSIYTSSQSKRTGVYFGIQKEGHDIEIFYSAEEVPGTWEAGGTLSGTMTCPWTYYERGTTWELAPASGSWSWTNLTYTAPVVKTITALEVSGTPTKTTYNVGDAFDPAGLVVTATYSDDTTAPITTGFEWEIDYGKTGEVANTAFVADATSVDVMAYIGDDVMSEVYTVNGLTVTVPVTLTSIAVSGTPTKTSYYVGDAFETAGLVVTGTYSDSHQETITEGIEWTVDPETLAEGTTSVDVMAGVGSVVSEVYTVEGLTVTKPDFETVTYKFSSFTSGKTVELTDLDGFVITLDGNGGTNPAWNSTASEARVYAKGSLTVKANNAIIKSIEYDYTVNANSKGVSPTIDGVEGATYAGTWDEENKTWTGADEEVTFSTSGSAGNIGFTKLIIKYVVGSKTETSLEWSAENAEVTIGADNNVFPTLTTNPTGLEGVTYESSNTEVATIAEDGTITLVKEGETTITANYEGDEEHTAAISVSYTLKVNKAPFVPTPVAEGFETVDFAAMYSSVTTNATVEDYEGTSFAMAFAKPSDSSTPTKYYDNGKAVRAYTNNTITITAAEPIAHVDIAWAGTYVDETVSITGIGTAEVVVKFGKNCRFTAITVYYHAISISAVGWGTYFTDKEFTMPEGVEGYIVTPNTNDNTKVVLTKVYEGGNTVPASTPLLIKGNEGAYPYVITTTNAEDLSEENCLHGNLTAGTVVEIPGATQYYKLLNGSKGLGWYLGAQNGGVFSLGANKAYLALTEAQANGSKGFSLDELMNETDGINSVNANTINDGNIYNLAGQRITAPVRGQMYIMNGKKYIAK